MSHPMPLLLLVSFHVDSWGFFLKLPTLPNPLSPVVCLPVYSKLENQACVAPSPWHPLAMGRKQRGYSCIPTKTVGILSSQPSGPWLSLQVRKSLKHQGGNR